MNVGFFSPPSSRERELFVGALERTDLLERQRYLDEACGGNQVLRAGVERLLRAEPEVGGFLEEPAVAAIQTRSIIAAGEEREQERLGERLGDRIGRYKLVAKISEGGCGVVYLAEQEEPVRRRVAVKVIKRGMDTDNVIARFEAERQALALMDHPNIAKVLDAGATETGRPYFVMELVLGVRITEYCDRSGLSTIERLKLFIQVCQAVQHAHQKGIIHRDIKPSNILVTMQDGQPVPKVIDFGIAKATEQRLTGSSLITAFHSFVGTPAYSSPEQAGMGGLDIDTRADIYSLGALLYELLTGFTPFDPVELAESGLDGMRRIICEAEPTRPSVRLAALGKEAAALVVRSRRERLPQVVAALRRDLDWIVMKCLEKDRTRRYATANALGMEIERHLEGEPVLARPPSAAYQVRKFAWRHHVALASTAAVALALIVGTVISTREAMRATAAEEVAVSAGKSEAAARTRADLLRYQARISVYVADINLAQHALESGNFGRAVQLLQSHRPNAGSSEPDLRGWEWRYLWSLSQGDERTELLVQPENPKSVYALASAPDERLLAIGLADSVIVWDTTIHSRIRTLNVGGRSLAFTPDGKTLVTADESTVRFWRVLDWSERGFLPESTAPIAIATDGTRLAAGAKNGGIRVVEASTLKELRFFPDAAGPIAFSPNGRMLAADSSAGSGIQLWPVDGSQNGIVLQASEGLFGNSWPRNAHTIAFTPDGKQVLAERRTESPRRVSVLNLWDAATGSLVGAIPDNPEAAHTGHISALDFGPDGRTLATASWDHSIRLWDVASHAHVSTINGHLTEVWGLLFAHDGQSLSSGGKDGSVNVWPISRTDEKDNLSGQWQPLRFARDGHMLALINPAGQPAILDLSTLQSKPEFAGNQIPSTWGGAAPIAFSDDLKIMVQVQNDGSLSVLDVETRLQRTLPLAARNVTSLTFLSDGALLVGGGRNASLSWWALSNLIQPLVVIQAPMTLVSQDGGTLAAFDPRGVGGNKVDVWDVTSHSWRTNVLIDASARNVQAISTDGRFLATTPGGNDVDNSVYLWDLTTGRRVGIFTGHKQPVYAVAFSPDRRTLATASDDGTVKMWHIVTHQELLTLPHLGGVGGSLMFSPDGEFLISQSRSTASAGLRIFRAPLLNEAELPGARLGVGMETQ